MGPPSKLLLLLSDDPPAKHPPMRFTPGGCCPCGAPQCQFCTSAPKEFRVTISGVTNSPCSTCDSVNGTYVLGYDPPSCTWQYSSAADAPCQLAGVKFVVQLNIEVEGGNLILRVALGVLGGMQWKLTLQVGSTAPIDCTAIAPDTNVPFWQNFDASCDNTTATCLVTAIAA